MRKYTIEYEKSTKQFVLNCDEFSEEFPSKIYILTGGKCWILNNHLHRTTGPAVICGDGYEVWYNNGVWITRPGTNEF